MPKIQDISRSRLIWGFKFLIIAFGLVYIYFYFNSIPVEEIAVFEKLNASKFVSLILILLIFSSLNWLGEIKKWQILVGHISFSASAKQSLIAHGLSLFTPQKLGEYGGKCLFYAKSEHYKIIALTGVGQFSQLLVTLIFGLLGLIILNSEFDVLQVLSFKWSLLFFIFSALLLIKPIRQHFKRILTVIKKVESSRITEAIGWSMLRYIIFSHQFYLLLMVFEIQIDYMTAIPVISLVYLIASVLPIFSIADALVKGSITLTIFGLVGFAEPSILVIAFLMWACNVMLPAILGYVWMVKWQPKLLMSKA